MFGTRRLVLITGAVLVFLILAATGFAATPADLVVVSISNPAGPFAPKAPFTIADTVHNVGGTDAGSSITRYYLSLDAVKSANDIRLTGSRSIVIVQAGIISSGSATVVVPSSTAAGRYTLFACTDDTKLVAEISETNNCSASGTPITVALPDLVETMISNPPALLAAGATLNVTDTVQNIGSVSAGASTTRYYLSPDSVKSAGDTLLTGTRNMATLGPGTLSNGTKTLTVPSTTPVGTYRVLACADDLLQQRESNESNNCAASAATITIEYADLTHSSVSNPPVTTSPGFQFNVTATIQNPGTVTSPASTSRYYLSVDGVRDAADVLLTGSRSVGTLAAGAVSTATKSVKVPITAPLGSYRVLACADDLFKVTETSETNNCAASGASVLVAWPDLVTITSDPPARLSAGRTFTATETTQNQGDAVAAASTTRYYLSTNDEKDATDVLLTTIRAIGALPPGVMSSATVTLTVPIDIVPATYVLLACADDLGAVTESDDGNNCHAARESVVAGPNTLPVADAGRDQDAALGSLIQLDGSASHDADMDTLLYEWSFVAVPPGSHPVLSDASATPTFTINAPGQYVIQLLVDDGKEYGLADIVTVTTGATRFGAIGDTGKGDAGQYQAASALVAKCNRSGCDFVALLGDNIYESGVTSVTDPQFQTKFELPYASIDVPFYAVLGNHDYGGGGEGNEFEKGQFQVDYTAYSSKWRMPAAHYRFTWDDVEFFGLDTNMQMYGLDEQQRADMTTWLQQSTASWKIALGHHPYRSNGSHGNAGAYGRIVGAGVGVKSFMEDVVCGRADLLLSGHDHNLQWLQPDRTCDGTELIVSGAGALPKPLRGADTAGYNETYFQAAQLGFVYFVVTEQQLTAQFIGGDGSVLYVRTVTKQP